MSTTVAWIGFACFFEWGLIHVLACCMMAPPALRNDVAAFYAGLIELAPQKDKDDLKKATYPKWTARALFQHALNLGWCGLFSFACCYWIAPGGTPNAMLPALSLVPWLADFAYLLAIDVPELGAIPGQAQTYIITCACICGALVTAEHHGASALRLSAQIAGFSTLAIAAVINKVTWLLGYRTRNPYGLL